MSTNQAVITDQSALNPPAPKLVLLWTGEEKSITLKLSGILYSDSVGSSEVTRLPITAQAAIGDPCLTLNQVII